MIVAESIAMQAGLDLRSLNGSEGTSDRELAVSLGLSLGKPENWKIGCLISTPVSTGDILGLYGQCGRACSYGDPPGPFQSEIFGMPTTLLINANGQEIGRMVGPAEWDSEEAKQLINAVIGTPAKG